MVLHFVRTMFADLSSSRPPDPEQAAGWETRSLVRSVRRVTLGFAALWQFAMVLLTFGTLGVGGWPLMLVQGALCVVALLALKYRHHDAVLPVGMAGAALWSYVASGDIDSALAFGASWQINFSSCIAGLLLLRAYAVPLVAATAGIVAAGLFVMLPDWGIAFTMLVMLTQFCIIIALRWGMSRLVRIARAADTVAAEAAEAQRRIRVTERVSAQMAEESRVLHDTAINTLGAIAQGGAGTADSEQVRAQCARDVALLRTLRTQPSLLTPAGLREIFQQPGLPLRRQGAGDDELARCERLLPTSTTTALVRCVQEAVTNATKHSGADHAIVDVAVSAAELRVIVRDRGTGFSGDTTAAGFGIGASIMERARDNGFDATVESRPGEGTTVSLTVPLHRRPQAADDEELVGQDSPLRRRAGEYWALGATAVSIVLAAAGSMNHGQALYPMIAIMLLAWSASRFVPSSRAHPAFIVFLTISSCLVFLLSAAATRFGTDGAIHWHALAATGPFILLLSLTSNGWVRTAAASCWAVVVLVAAAVVQSSSVTAAQIVLAAGVVGLAFAGVWAAFQNVLQRLSEQSATSSRDLVEANIRADLDIATQNSFRRWIGAGLDSAILLLDDIANGLRDPHRAGTREACAEEERYLRQIVQLSPRFVHLSNQLPRTLHLARERQIIYLLRLGGADAPDESAAHDIAASIEGALSVLEPDEALHASIFPVRNGVQLTLLGPRIGHMAQGTQPMRYERLGAVELLELTYAREQDAARADAISAEEQPS